MEELPPPPPPVEPPVESAWERGLRHAKEVNTSTASHGNKIEFVPNRTAGVLLRVCKLTDHSRPVVGFAVLLYY